MGHGQMLQVNSTQVDLLGKFPLFLQNSSEGVELTQCYMARTEPTVSPESEIQQSIGLSSPAPLNRTYQGG